jgi:predicted alpha/beta superfamily hydrolase
MLEGLLGKDDDAGVMWEMPTLEGMSVGGVLSETSRLEQPTLFSGSTVSSGNFSPQEPRALPMEDGADQDRRNVGTPI